VSNDLHKRVERVLLETLGRSHEHVAKAIVRDVLEDKRAPLRSNDVWKMKLDAAEAVERDRESILRRYKVLQVRLVKVRAWLEKSDEGADALMYDSGPNYAQLADILDGREDKP
jgi:hypothetical protein